MTDSETPALNDRFNSAIAVTVATMTCFLAISNIENGKLGDDARDSQIAAVSIWNQYQGKRIRQYLLESSITNAVALRTEAMGRQVDRAIVDWQIEAERYRKELEELAATGRDRETTWRDAGRRGQLFTLAETFLTVSLAGLAIAALVRRKWLFAFSFAIGLIGMAYSLSGFFGWMTLLPT